MSVRTSLKKSGLALGIALAFAAGNAAAATYDLPSTNGFPVPVALGGGSFTDYFKFTVTTASTGIFDAESSAFTFWYGPSSITLPAVQFTGFTLGTDTTSSFWSSSPATPMSSFNSTYSGPLAAGTTYYLGVSGSAGPAGGLYGVGVLAAPVPEPGEWAMMLAGLGLVGMIARRRSKRA
jgi:hypothetical protein